MIKKYLVLFGFAFSISLSGLAKDYLLSTNKTSLLISASEGEKSFFQYYGGKVTEDDIKGIYEAGTALNVETYPTFGVTPGIEKALSVVHADGTLSTDLVVDKVNQYQSEDGNILEIVMKDRVYPLKIKQFYKAYKETDIISTWVEILNTGSKPIHLQKFSSAFLPVRRGENWLTHFHGGWAAESMLEEEKLTNGQKIIANTDGTRNTQTDYPSVMLSVDGRPQEETGHVIGVSLAWSGNYIIKTIANNMMINLLAGILEDNSQYLLESDETFTTPELAMTYSLEGKGGVSRAFHRWALKYKLHNGYKERDVLLNSWEGVYFNVSQSEMNKMMREISSMGGELFVMDDGWFGDKYPRNSAASGLGDWTVNKNKLPMGIEGLVDYAKEQNIKFGIWIEPEMANIKSELFEKHPDWILKDDNRPLTAGRSKTQVVLDLSNPEVQDFVFGVVDDLMKKYPEIAYIKWDANCGIMNYASQYLPSDKQSHIYIEYHKGLVNVLKRIREKYPELVMQACASGGGRMNYGLLPYFEEFWTSDNTDALQRVYMQWSVSNFLPAAAMAAHVSAEKNHNTGRVTPLKYRFDVAMSGRLGMEIQPSDMSVEEKEFAKCAIESYKKIRPIVQFGDLYRLVSPYDNKGIASLMYVTPDKDKAVAFVYKIHHLRRAIIPDVRFNGLDKNKKYRITDLTPNGEKRSLLDGKIFSGNQLMTSGISIIKDMKEEYSSLALILEEIK